MWFYFFGALWRFVSLVSRLMNGLLDSNVRALLAIRFGSRRAFLRAVELWTDERTRVRIHSSSTLAGFAQLLVRLSTGACSARTAASCAIKFS